MPDASKKPPKAKGEKKERKLAKPKGIKTQEAMAEQLAKKHKVDLDGAGGGDALKTLQQLQDVDKDATVFEEN